MSMRCWSDEHYSVIRPAVAYLIMWPVLIPLLCFVAVWSCRSAIRSGHHTDWSKATQVLHYEYRPAVWGWESCSLLQRLLLTGYACLIPNSAGVIRT
eukprot:1858259-Prymnesium_polylepis.1